MRRYLSEKLQDGYEIEIVNYSDLKIKNHTEWIIKKFDIKTMHIVEVNDFLNFVGELRWHQKISMSL